MHFLTLQEYLLQARKIMLATGRGFLVKDEDAVAHVAYRMMLADHTWDGRSDRGTWRFNQAKYAMQNFLKKQKLLRQRLPQISLDDGILDSQGKIRRRSDFIPQQEPDDTVERYNEVCHTAHQVLSGNDLRCFQLRHEEGMSITDIGVIFGCTKQNISLKMKRIEKRLQNECANQTCYT